MSVQVIDTLKPKNNGTFPVVEAEDVAISDELRLPEALNAKAEQTDLEELSSELENKADTSDITDLQSQIDQIAQAAGTGSADTEVAQARVAADGTSYQTLKARCDATDNTLDSLYNDVWSVEKDEITYSHGDLEWENGYIDTNGTVASHLYYRTSNYIEVEAGDLMTYNGLRSPSTSYAIIAVYDDSKTYSGSASVKGDGTQSQTGTFTIPSGAKYIRIVTYADSEWTFVSATIPTVVRTFCTDELEDNVSELSSTVDEYGDRIEALEESVPMIDYHITSFNSLDITEVGGIDKYNGSDLEYQYLVRSDYISTEDIKSIYVKIKILSTGDHYAAAVACYDASKNYIRNKSIIPDWGGGTWDYCEGTITIDNDIKYIRISRNEGENGKNDLIDMLCSRPLADDYEVTKGEVENIEKSLDSPWEGKKWYAFGTSLTDDRYMDPNNDPTGKYPQLLNVYAKAVLHNHGKGGGGITSHSNGSILSEIQNTDFSDADLITLEGFANDYSAAPGNFTDTTTDTLCGALYVALSEIYEKAPRATVVLITDSQGQLNQQGVGYPIDFVSATGNRQVEYNEAIIRMARYFGCHVVDAGGRSQINNFHPEYLVDHIHHSWAGGQQYADTIWEELKNIHPNTANPYFESE